jgi:hypothetical protein
MDWQHADGAESLQRAQDFIESVRTPDQGRRSIWPQDSFCGFDPGGETA